MYSSSLLQCTCLIGSDHAWIVITRLLLETNSFFQRIRGRLLKLLQYINFNAWREKMRISILSNSHRVLLPVYMFNNNCQVSNCSSSFAHLLLLWIRLWTGVKNKQRGCYWRRKWLGLRSGCSSHIAVCLRWRERGFHIIWRFRSTIYARQCFCALCC